MEFIIKDTNFSPIGLLEVYTSAIWTERYQSIGDFQIDVPLVADAIQYLIIDNYLTYPESDRAMIIASMDVKSDIETGERYIRYTGESLESILKRRIVWKQTELSGDALTELKRVFDENITFPNLSQHDPEYAEKSKRKISNFVYTNPTSGDPVYTLLHGRNIDAQFMGETLYDVVVSFCEAFDVGFKITLTTDNKFKFELYAPVNRTADQSANDPIVFSPDFDTLRNSEWLQNYTNYKNVTLVIGEREDDTIVRRVVYGGTEPSGLARREIYTDAKSIKDTDDDGNPVPDYEANLDYKGYETLMENTYAAAFDGEVETSVGPQYGEDYFMGDYVSVINEYGFGASAQIKEYIRSQDSSGFKAYPAFEMVN